MNKRSQDDGARLRRARRGRRTILRRDCRTGSIEAEDRAGGEARAAARRPFFRSANVSERLPHAGVGLHRWGQVRTIADHMAKGSDRAKNEPAFRACSTRPFR